MSGNNPFDELDVPDDPLDDLNRVTQRLLIHTEERRYGKQMVIVEGFDNDTDVDQLASELKSALGTGGTVKDGHIELQGNHADRVRELLTDKGYTIAD